MPLGQHSRQGPSRAAQGWQLQSKPGLAKFPTSRQPCAPEQLFGGGGCVSEWAEAMFRAEGQQPGTLSPQW